MAIPLLTGTALQTELAQMLGEQGLQANLLTSRLQYLQDSLKDAWKMYPWPFSMVDVTLAFTSGVATLPNDFMPDGHFYLDDGIKEWGNIEYSERLQSKRTGASNTFYIRYNNASNVYEAVMVDSSGLPSTSVSLNFRYQFNPLPIADTTTAGVSAPTAYPNASTLAKGALRYVIKSDNQDADTSQEETAFQAACEADYSAFNRIKNRNKRAVGLSESRGHASGMYA